MSHHSQLQKPKWLHSPENSSKQRGQVHLGSIQSAVRQRRPDDPTLHRQQAAHQRCRTHVPNIPRRTLTKRHWPECFVFEV